MTAPLSGQDIVEILTEINAPVTLSEIVDCVASSQEESPSKGMVENLQITLDAGVKFGFFQHFKDHYYLLPDASAEQWRAILSDDVDVKASGVDVNAGKSESSLPSNVPEKKQFDDHKANKDLVAHEASKDIQSGSFEEQTKDIIDHSLTCPRDCAACQRRARERRKRRSRSRKSRSRSRSRRR